VTRLFKGLLLNLFIVISKESSTEKSLTIQHKRFLPSVEMTLNRIMQQTLQQAVYKC